MFVEIMLLAIVGLVCTYVLTVSIADKSKSADFDTIDLKMSERDKAFNMLDNAESVEVIDMACYKLKADDCRQELILKQLKDEEYATAFGDGKFNDKGVWEGTNDIL